MIKAGLITRVVSKLSRHGNVSVTDQILRLCYHLLHPPERIHYNSSVHQYRIVDAHDNQYYQLLYLSFLMHIADLSSALFCCMYGPIWAYMIRSDLVNLK